MARKVLTATVTLTFGALTGATLAAPVSATYAMPVGVAFGIAATAVYFSRQKIEGPVEAELVPASFGSEVAHSRMSVPGAQVPVRSFGMSPDEGRGLLLSDLIETKEIEDHLAEIEHRLSDISVQVDTSRSR